MNQNLIEQANVLLIAWAIQALAGWTESDPRSLLDGLEASTLDSLTPFGRLLSSDWAPERYPEGCLLFIPSLVRPAGADKAESVSLPCRPLSLEQATILHEEEDDLQLWPDFVNEFRALRGGDSQVLFESFSHLFHKYAWAAPCTYGEKGISLYEEFKVLAALMHASGGSDQPAEKFLLVSGDTSGIQDFLYTVTHRAAAKGLRGRSFFLQLLSDAAVRAILALWALPSTNVIYAAGGNFLLLGPAGVGAETCLQGFIHQFNQTLLDVARGDLNLAVKWREIPAEVIGDSEKWQAALRDTEGWRGGGGKARPFADVAQEDWAAVFGLADAGGKRYCTVCHAGLLPGEGKKLEGEEGHICDLCDSFTDLAEAIACEEPWMVVERAGGQDVQGRGWADALIKLTGFRYGFTSSRPAHERAITYAVNSPNLLQAGAHGFWMVANVTPVIQPDDCRKWQERGMPEDQWPVGRVRDFDLMAWDAQGIERVAALRMDVDNLGRVFAQYNPTRAMAGTSALSFAIDLFFASLLNGVVKEVGDNAAYMLYAGGDDLFIVGAWDRMVMLAERIRDDFHQYTGGNPHLTISAGISLMERTKFPLYLAALQAHDAENLAKGPREELELQDGLVRVRLVEREGKKLPPEKNAICFLRQTVGWERWPRVRVMQEELVRLCKEEGVPRALIQTVRSIHVQYERGRQEYEVAQRKRGKRPEEIREYPMFHGRWMWLAAYQLTRMARQHQRVAERLRALQRKIVQPEMTPYSGLAARWAEYLTRKGGHYE